MQALGPRAAGTSRVDDMMRRDGGDRMLTRMRPRGRGANRADGHHEHREQRRERAMQTMTPADRGAEEPGGAQ
jgi:hypothetical protein